MKTEILGQGEPDYGVIYHIHGDEPCGRKAVERFKDSDYEVQKPVKLVFANERAAEKKTRYTETDLNRSFPGDPESDLYEERLAAKILEEVEGLTCLNIHSTRSQPTPFGTLKNLEDETVELSRSLGVQNFALFEDGENSLEYFADSILVEAGPQGTENAVEQAYTVLLNFLAYHGIIDREFELIEPNIYRVFDTVEGSGYEFFGANFQKVAEGDRYAKKDSKPVTAEDDFYPVLMSTNGYENMLGFKAEKIQ